MWHLGYADAMKHDSVNLVTAANADDATRSDGDSDENYNISDDSDSDSDSDSVSDCSASFAPANACNIGDGDDDEESHWNDLWFINSNDDDSSDCNDEYSQYVEDTEDDNDSNSEDVDGYGLEHINLYATPTDLSLRECRAQSLYGRACNSLSLLRTIAKRKPNAVHAAY
jgi:hypothetical protein